MGGFVVTPLLLSDSIYGYAVGTVALAMAPRPGAFAVSAPLGGWIATRVGEGPPMIAASTMMVASMVSFAAGSRPGALVFVLAGLVLSGAAAGIGAPSYTSLVVRSVDPSDVGVATGMNQTMLFMGIVSGIQIMLVVLGDSPSQARYAGTFLAGAAIAGLGLVASAIAAASVNRRSAATASELPAVLAAPPPPGAEQGVSA
jgi:MFS family permease